MLRFRPSGSLLVTLAFITQLAAFTGPVQAVNSGSTLLPDSPFYFTKQLTNWAKLSFSLGSKSHLQTEADIAGDTLTEVKLLADQSKNDLAEKQLESYNKQVEMTVADARKLVARSKDQSIIQSLNQQIQDQHHTVTDLANQSNFKVNSDVLDQSLFLGTWSKAEIAVAATDNGQTTSNAPTSQSLTNALQSSDNLSLASETVPDGTIINPNLKFNKSWVLKNSGAVTWKNYSIRFVKGNNLAATGRINFTPTESVSPGTTRSVSIDMVSPKDPGTYYSGWQLFNSKDQPVGSIFFANIVVPKPSPQPTAAPATKGKVTPSPPPSPPSNGWIKVPILMYHYIREVNAAADPLGFSLSVKPNEFDKQMGYLQSHGYHPIRLDELYNAITRGAGLPSNPIVLTFDDGYSDFFYNATPIMIRHRMFGVTYDVPGFIGNPAYMSWDQLSQVKAAGMEIEDHTNHHIDLTKASAATINNELHDSKSALESHLGISVHHFAYPYGSFNAQAINLVRQAGFITATTTYSGLLHNQTTLLTLRRVRISGGDSLAIFASKIK